MAKSKDNRSGKVAESEAIELPLNDQYEGDAGTTGDGLALTDKVTGEAYKIYVKNGKLTMEEV